MAGSNNKKSGIHIYNYVDNLLYIMGWNYIHLVANLHESLSTPE